ncbi:MAG TPA: efflux RND transporter permease subunit [Armatimonadota bacterium]|jgi:HAE1 family hydrophobic/amphiphilic exporter-1
MASPPQEAPRAGSGLAAITRASIEHPWVVVSFYLGVVVLAVLVIGFYMPRRFMPYVPSPVVGVFTMMPGLSAQEMELYISKPIEEQMTNIRGVHYLRSTSQDGFSVVSLEFYYGADMKKALFDVQSLMNLIQSNLPVTSANLKPSWVLAIDPLNIPVLSLSVTHDSWDPVRLRQFCDNEVVNRLKQFVPDVYSVSAFGGYRRQLQVIADRNKLAARGLSILDVRDAVDRFNVSRPGGVLTSGGDETIVRADTRAQDAQTVAEYPVTAGGGAGSGARPASGGGGMGGGGSGGSPAASPTPAAPATGPAASPRVVQVKDVARVVDSFWERRSGYHMVTHEVGKEGQIVPSLEVSIVQNPEASSATVIANARKVLAQLEQENPGLKFTVAYDNAHFVGVLFRNLLEELGVAVLLCGIVVFFFLGEWRGTLISLITIPTSLSMAIICLMPLGMTLNSGTLIGLLLSIGRLVDDTIIDVHATERHLRMGKTPKQATIDGISEVRLAVLASTFVMLLALSPLLFVGGIVELMFRELVWPLIFALLASMVVSFTLTSLLAANLLRPESARAAEQRTWFFVLVVNPFQRLLERMERGYGRAIGWLLHHRFANLARILVTLVIGFGFYYFIGSEMMPLADVGQAYGVLEMAPGTSYAATEQAVTQVEKIMLKYPEIQLVSTEIGAETMLESNSTYFTGYAVPQVNAATFMITLSDLSERNRDIWKVVDGVRAEALATIPGVRRLQIKEMGSDVMATSQAPISLIVYGPDLNVLDRMGQEVARIAEKSGVRQVATDWTMGAPSYQIRINQAKAQQLGLSTESISQQAYYALKGGLTNEFYRLPNLRQDTILVRYEPDQRRGPADLGNVYLTTPDGRQVPLSAVASIDWESTPTLISHDGIRRVVSVLGFYRKGETPSMDLTMGVQMNAMAQLNFPPGYGIEMRGDMTQMMDSFRRLFGGLALAVIFIFLVLIAQFRGFFQPLQMVFSLPLELSGVFIALFLAHMTFSTVSILGIIVLTGMDVTTAILLIDMIMHYRDRGVKRDDAVRWACPQRLRPILMTSIITIVVMIPVAFFPKTGMDAYAPLAMVVIGGLAMGTILSLFDIPIMHTYVDDLNRWLERKFLHREYQWPVTHSLDDGVVQIPEEDE